MSNTNPTIPDNDCGEGIKTMLLLLISGATLLSLVARIILA